MKRCPQCDRYYADESLFYCIQDGQILSALRDPEETVVLSGSINPPQKLMPYIASKPQSSFNHSNLGRYAIMLFAVLLTGSGVAFYYENKKTVSQNNSATSNLNVSEQSATNSNNPSVSSNKNQAHYIVTSCNSIKDTQTGLEWLIGPDRNMTWYEARQWIENLNMCGNGWRMPTIDEIQTLYNPGVKAGTGYYTNGRFFPAHIDPIFNNIGSGSWVWSNQNFNDGTAQSFNLNQGKPVVYSAMNTLYSTRAFAVRIIIN